MAAGQRRAWTSDSHRLAVGAIAAVVLLTLTMSGLAESAKMVVFNNRYVKKSGDTMTGTLIIDRDGRQCLVLDGHMQIDLDWDEMIAGSAGIEFTQAGTQTGDEWFIKLPETGAPSAGIDSAFNWKTYNMWPVLDNTYQAGGSLNRYSKIWSYEGDFANTVTVDKDTVGNLLVLKPDWSLGTVVGIDMVNAGGTYDLNDFYLRFNDVFGGGEYDGIRSDGVWRGAFFQAGNGESLIADGVPKCSMYPGGIYAEPNFDYPYPFWAGTFINASDYTVTGPVPASAIFFNVGDAGGALAKDVTLSFLGVFTINQVDPVDDGVGHVGSTSGDAFGQIVGKEVAAEESIHLPSDIDTYTGHDGITEFELSYQDTPTVTEEWLRIGNTEAGTVSISARGNVVIDTDGPQNENALTVQRDGSGVYTIFRDGGQFFTTNSSITDLSHMTGFTVFPAYEQTDDGDDVGYYGPAGMAVHRGAEVYISRIWLDLETETNNAYVDNLRIVQRDADAMIVEELWSQAVTLGSGNTDYISTYVDVSPAVTTDRLGLVEVSCDNSPADWIRLGRVGVEWDTRLP